MTPASVLPDPALNDLPESDEPTVDRSHETSGDAAADPNAEMSSESQAEEAEAAIAEAAIAEAAIAEPELPPTVTVPDRADAPVSETVERFMRAIAAVVPIDRIEELHLFSPLRQGGVETGIAVIAARVDLPPEPATADDAPELALEGDAATLDASDAASSTTTAEGVDADGAELVDATLTDAESVDAEIVGAQDESTPVVETELVAESADSSAVDAELVDADARGVVEADTGDDTIAGENERLADAGMPVLDTTPEPDDSPYAPETIHDIVEDAIETTAEIITEVVASEQAVAAPIERHTVYTARYRLVQKGPERGKWEADVRDEADAPLITVEMVVRGVQRRAGEASETTRYTGPQVARILARGAKPA